MISYKFARRSFLRGAGGLAPADASAAALDRGAGGRRGGAAAASDHSSSAGRGSGAHELASRTPARRRPASRCRCESAPFAPLQKYMVMVDGLNIVPPSPAGRTANSGQNTPEGGMVALMTGVPTHREGGAAGSLCRRSVDRSAVAAKVADAGRAQLRAARRRSVRCSWPPTFGRTGTRSRRACCRIWRPRSAVTDPGLARQPLYPETSPLNVYNRIFGGALPTADDGAARLAQKLSAINYMRRDLARLRSLVPASEKDRLDAYADAITQLEASLRARVREHGAAPACTPPPTPPAFANTSTGKQGAGTVYSHSARRRLLRARAAHQPSARGSRS